MTTAYINCPHCGNRMRSNSHKTISPLLKTVKAVCHNPECLASFNVNIEIAKPLQPSLSPVPEIAAALNKMSGTPR